MRGKSRNNHTREEAVNNHGYRVLKARVGGKRFTIYDILRIGTPPAEIRRLTALIQSLMFIGRARRVGKTISPNRKRWINQYVLV